MCWRRMCFRRAPIVDAQLTTLFRSRLAASRRAEELAILRTTTEARNARYTASKAERCKLLRTGVTPLDPSVDPVAWRR